jgi:uncharacterized protein (TIGR03435 family)
VKSGTTRSMLLMLAASRIAVLMPLMFILAGTPLPAQPAVSPATLAQQPAELPVASFAFDVATIKPSDADPRRFGGGFDALGYHFTNFPLSGIVFSAYFPLNAGGHQLIGVPAWAEKERYDIVAHVDDATAPSWLKLSPTRRQDPGRAMLQKLLAERCKLVAHIVPTQIDGYVIVVGKSGSRLVPSKPGATYPDGAKNGPDGSRVVPSSSDNNMTESYFNATVEQLAERLSGGGWVIVDRTNLTGRYDFTFRRLEIPQGADGKRISDPQPYDLWDISGTGLEIRRAKVPSQNLVIDHIERPSPN